jgi:hypothetical protein
MPRPTGRFAAFCLGFALASTAGLPAGSVRAAEAAPPQVTDLTYEVYVGGLHIFSFAVEMTLQPDRYRLTAQGATEGMVGWVYTFDLNLVAEGLDRDGRIAPSRYVAATQWQNRQRKTVLDFGKGGRYALQQDPPPEPDPDIEGELPESLPEGTVDPLSLAVAASRALEQTGRCDQTLPVFDGQRRFDVTVKQLGETTLPANRYSIYQGPAVRCGIGVERISGFRKSFRAKRNQEARSTPPVIWMASIRPDLPPVPVRYEGEIALGKIVIHLTGAEFGTESSAAPN